MENCQKWSVFVFISLKKSKVAFARGAPDRFQWSADHGLRTAVITTCKYKEFDEQ